MVELRSGTNTGGQEPRTTEGRDPNIPEDIEVIEQGVQMANQGVQVMDPTNQQGLHQAVFGRKTSRIPGFRWLERTLGQEGFDSGRTKVTSSILLGLVG